MAFARQGSDLVLSDPAGNEAVVRGNFAGGGQPADLVTAGGAIVHGGTDSFLAGALSLVQVAQLGAALGPAPIGRLRVVQGAAKIIHDGVEQDATADNDLYRNDVIVTGPDSAIGVRFVDGTNFSLSGNGRLVMDQFAYSRRATWARCYSAC